MTIALIGASGRAGSHILKELSDRGHAVTGIARDPSGIAVLPGVRPVAADAANVASLAAALSGHDTVVSSIKFTQSDPGALIEAVKSAGATRYLVVGGAGSLLNDEGIQLFETPGFTEGFKAEAEAGAAFLELLRAEPSLDWTFLSPASLFVDGERTGRFRLGMDTALKAEGGPSRISFADYAIAMVDEIETPRHHRSRFSVAY